MKKLISTILSLCLALTLSIIPNAEHTHDENCGYDPSTDTGCIYEIEPFFILPPDELDPDD